MMTVRQIERLWSSQAYLRLLQQVMEPRPEYSPQLGMELGRMVPAAAMAVVRLDELSQAHTEIAGRLLRAILVAQEADGGWGDVMTTALCLRALRVGNGQGPAIERGLAYLANLQKEDGLWPRVPIRRMAADGFVSAFVLLHLGDDARFRASVRWQQTAEWFRAHTRELDGETRRLWQLAENRCLWPTTPRRTPVAA